MKKLSLLIAMILMVTIGGVYATWYYANTDVLDINDHTVAIALGTTQNTTGVGTYSLESNVAMIIDPKGAVGSADQHIAELKYYQLDEAGKATTTTADDSYVAFTLVYTPAAADSADRKTNGLTTYWKLSLSDGASVTTWKWGEVQIFTSIDTDQKTIHPVNGADQKWTAVDTGSDGITDYFKYEITVGEMKNMIQLNNNILLDTNAKHGSFASALSTAGIFLNVSDGTVNG